MATRGLGIRKDAIQRVAQHYNISESEAEQWLQIHPEEMLLPERGTGLSRGTASGVGSLGSSTGAWLIGGFLGAVAGGLLGVIIFSALESNETT